MTVKLPQERDEQPQAVKLFQQMRYHLLEDVKELESHFNIARNLACTEWSDNFIDNLTPNQMFPDRMDLLHKNFDMLRSELSYKRYLLIKAFIPLVGGKMSTGGSILLNAPGEAKVNLSLEYPFSIDDQDCYSYWNKKMKAKAKKTSKKVKK